MVHSSSLSNLNTDIFLKWAEVLPHDVEASVRCLHYFGARCTYGHTFISSSSSSSALWNGNTSLQQTNTEINKDLKVGESNWKQQNIFWQEGIKRRNYDGKTLFSIDILIRDLIVVFSCHTFLKIFRNNA